MSKGESTLTDSIECCASCPEVPGQGEVRTASLCVFGPLRDQMPPSAPVPCQLDPAQHLRTLLPEVLFPPSLIHPSVSLTVPLAAELAQGTKGLSLGFLSLSQWVSGLPAPAHTPSHWSVGRYGASQWIRDSGLDILIKNNPLLVQSFTVS